MYLSKALHILYIASWLPNKYDKYEGDFILRHAQAISLLNKVSIAFVIETETTEDEVWEYEEAENLAIYRVYLNKKYTSIWSKQKYYTTVENIFLKVNNSKQKVDLIHAQVHWRDGYAAYKLHNKYKLPYIISEHSAYFNTAYYKNNSNSVAKYNLIKKALAKKAISHAAYILPVSNYLAQWMQNFTLIKNIKVISNVVDTNYFYYKEKPNGIFTFMHASMLWPEKNTDKILEACKILNLKKVEFVLHLYAPENKEVDDYINTHNLQNVIIKKGLVPHSAMPAAMQASHAHILFSSAETQGCVLIESLCCGTPVIAGKAAVFTEMINEKNGIIINSTDANELANNMIYLMSIYNTFQLNKIAEDAANKYSNVSIAAAFTKIYYAVLGIKV
jgi:glycosyltransferase involved in cell wall biosynthesis